MTDRLRQRIVRSYEAGHSSRAVAAEYDVGKATVLKVLADAGVAMRPSHVTY